jgi:hypothetical protein
MKTVDQTLILRWYNNQSKETKKALRKYIPLQRNKTNLTTYTKQYGN